MKRGSIEALEIRDFAIGRCVSPEVLARLGREGILNHVEQAPDGTLLRSVAVALVDAPLEAIVSEVRGIKTRQGGFLRDVNIIHKVTVLQERPQGLRIRLELRYRFLLFRTTFRVDADVTVDEEGRLDLVGIKGKPEGLKAHFRAQPVDVGEGPQSLVFCSLRFEVSSLGWLVDYFLRHHPEIELGVFSATAPVIVLTLKEAVEKRKQEPS
ncbi:MAG: hypothetical protein ABI333_23590 [bacterium]